MKVSQLDQIKQAYEQGLSTIQLLNQRIEIMKQVREIFQTTNDKFLLLTFLEIQ